MIQSAPASAAEIPDERPAGADRTVTTEHPLARDREDDVLTFWIHGQLFGLRILDVHDVLSHARLTRIPLAPPEIAGALNLRGRITTAIDTRRRIGFPPADGQARHLSVVVEHRGELYNLIVDEVGDVMQLSSDRYEDNPNTLDPLWRQFSKGIYRLDHALLVLLDVAKLVSGPST